MDSRLRQERWRELRLYFSCMGLFYLCLPLCQYGFHSNMSSSQVYAIFRDAVNKTGRPMAQNIKFDIEPDGFEGGPELANSWRTGR